MLTITKEFAFNAAHRLYLQELSEDENRRIYGPCASLHGHTYKLLVTISGDLDRNGMIINFSRLEFIVHEEIVGRYDHSCLNDLEEYATIPATAENMVSYIFPRLEQRMQQENLTLESISLYETSTAWATYSRSS